MKPIALLAVWTSGACAMIAWLPGMAHPNVAFVASLGLLAFGVAAIRDHAARRP